MRLLKETGIIIAISITVALLYNFINPKGLAFRGDFEKYSKETAENTNQGDPNKTQNTPPKRKLNKEGFYEPSKIKIEYAKQLYDKQAVFLDARIPEENNRGHIQRSVSQPFESFHKLSKEERLVVMEKIIKDKDGMIVCYCNGGECDISIDLAYDIAKAGYTNVHIYLGGYKEWEDAGYPVEKDK